jgi:hypothetical protein
LRIKLAGWSLWIFQESRVLCKEEEVKANRIGDFDVLGKAFSAEVLEHNMGGHAAMR